MTVRPLDGRAAVMFLSVDLVRSKQLKTAYMRRRESWLPLFRDLFETFPLIFVGRVAQRFESQEDVADYRVRSEEHTSELQSLMRISYAVFCLKKNNKNIYK